MDHGGKKKRIENSPVEMSLYRSYFVHQIYATCYKYDHGV